MDWDGYTLFFISLQQSYGPWLTLKFCLCSSSELIDGFRSSFVDPLVLIKLGKNHYNFFSVNFQWSHVRICFHSIS